MATTSAVLQRQLTYLLGVKQRVYRPAKWRQFIKIKTGMPEWMENFEVWRMKENAQEPVLYQLQGNRAPMPNVERDSGTGRVFELALAYDIQKIDLDRAAITGVNVSDAKVRANARSTEEFLEKIAAFGKTTKLPISIGSGLLRGNDGGVGVPVLNAAADNSGFPLVGSWLTGSATSEEIVSDVGNTLFKVKDYSKEYHTANLFLMPDTHEQYLATHNVEDGSRSILSAIKEAYPGVTFMSWYQCRAAGGTLTGITGDKTRCMACEVSDDVVQMIMVHEMRDDPPFQVSSRAWEVLQTMRTGGVQWWDPAGAAYADGL